MTAKKIFSIAALSLLASLTANADSDHTTLNDRRTETAPLSEELLRDFEECTVYYEKIYNHHQTDPVNGTYDDSPLNPDAEPQKAVAIELKNDFQLTIDRLRPGESLDPQQTPPQLTLAMINRKLIPQEPFWLKNFKITASPVNAPKNLSSPCTLTLTLKETAKLDDRGYFLSFKSMVNALLAATDYYSNVFTVNTPAEFKDIPFSSFQFSCETPQQLFKPFGLEKPVLKHITRKFCDELKKRAEEKDKNDLDAAKNANVLPDKMPTALLLVEKESTSKIATPLSLLVLSDPIQLGRGYDSKTGEIKELECVSGSERSYLTPLQTAAFFIKYENRIDDRTIPSRKRPGRITRSTLTEERQAALMGAKVVDYSKIIASPAFASMDLDMMEEEEFRKKCGDSFIAETDYGTSVMVPVIIDKQNNAKPKSLIALNKALNELTDYASNAVAPLDFYGEIAARFKELGDRHPDLKLAFKRLDYKILVNRRTVHALIPLSKTAPSPFAFWSSTIEDTFSARLDPRERALVGFRAQSYDDLRKRYTTQKNEEEKRKARDAYKAKLEEIIRNKKK